MASSKYAPENVITTPVELRCDPPLSPESMFLSSLAAVQLNAATLRLGGGGFGGLATIICP